jgi:ABC-2 type transport system ATP-binding protein
MERAMGRTEEPTMDSTLSPILDVREVFKAYEGFALKDVSFALPRGYIMGLIGPNGAGKTTLLKLILDLVRPDAGEIKVFGRNVAEHGAAQRARIGFVHENPRFYEGLPLERAAAVIRRFYPSWDEGRFRSLAREFGLPLGKKLKTLSQGNRTRFALAVALAHGAELLLLDEPSSGLDPAFRRDLLDRLSGIIEGGNASVLFSTHITSDLDRVADFITFLQCGRLRFSMTKDEVLERHALVKGEVGLLTEEVRRLFCGVETGDFGFVGLTGDLPAVRAALKGEPIVVDRATLEDVVFYTGRIGKGGLKLHDDPV